MNGMQNGMSPDDRAWFLAEVAKYFPATGEIEREVLRLALPRLGGFPRETIRATMMDWAIRWGGTKGRFFIGSFLEALGERSESRKREADRVALLARADDDRLRLFAERQEVAADADALRETILHAEASRVDAALQFLRESGWSAPPSHVDAWGMRWLVAVSDLLTDRGWPDLHASPVERDGRSVRDDSPRIPIREAIRAAGRPQTLGIP